MDAAALEALACRAMHSAGPSLGKDYFNRGHVLSQVQARLSRQVRRRMFQTWMDRAGEIAGLRVLDVGATPDQEREDSNCMLPWLLEAGAQVSLFSPEDITPLETIFPGTKVLPAMPLQPVFDWVVSSAVLEHVGSRAQQVAFLASLGAAGKGIFLTTPNRHHWLEFHTKLPVLHWLPRRAHRSILRGLGMDLWAQEEQLRLVDRRELRRLATEALGSAFTVDVTHTWALGMPSNLILIARAVPHV